MFKYIQKILCKASNNQNIESSDRIIKSSYIWTPGYYVANSSQMLIKTGAFVRDNGGIKFGRTAIKIPGQYVSYANMNPITYEFDIHNMSKEKVEFGLPMVFTVCPIHPNDDKEGFLNYAQKTHNMTAIEIRTILGGIIEGETRTFTASMTVEEMFSDKTGFKKNVIEKINEDLKNIGLKIINANIKEMKDYDDNNKYFIYRKQRAIETANYNAQVDVAEAKRHGELGKAEKEKDTRIGKAQYEQEATLKENNFAKMTSDSNTELSIVNIENNRKEKFAVLDANAKNELQNQEFLKLIEQKKKEAQEAKYRAEKLSEANVQFEITQKNADAKRYEIEQIAIAKLTEKQKEADGILAIYNAQADGIKNIISATGDPKLAMFYLSLQRGVYEELAKHASNGLNGLTPKITIVHSDKNSNPIDPIVNMMSSIVPGLDLIKETFISAQKTTIDTSQKLIK